MFRADLNSGRALTSRKASLTASSRRILVTGIAFASVPFVDHLTNDSLDSRRCDSAVNRQRPALDAVRGSDDGDGAALVLVMGMGLPKSSFEIPQIFEMVNVAHEPEGANDRAEVSL